ncbi:2-aminobenzoate-CoA ligase (plasmid) [Deinococcus metallilatus]|uniref:2-aminobenzoate-CoA ligase n=1 Tax=Deinococcus metallilatus TaxID=1211322 RepID=A0ABR6MUX1_9DEIO|nr:AMP-binding protein [Deinococcus metallilatus]MBB5295748.1 2-aminobenzoate-CoA ligase [Deinococcus metallilatus]QBY06810.1 2-aminobenzoate-CoA ligase [Deinococcus metallilatus]GMA14277.1 2-aminobenzoate-CoA ligase [Deinococcus metallilatus]
MNPSAYTDTFARDHLPPREQWPELIFDLPELQYPARLNAAVELLDRQAQQHPERVALLAEGQRWTYGELQARSNQIAHVLREDLGLVPGNRVLLHGPNTPMLAACWFAILKAGGIVVSTMPLLRAPELVKIIGKARVSHALSDASCLDTLLQAQRDAPSLTTLRSFRADGGELLALAETKPADFTPVETASDDVALIAFTSGTTGQPKGCLHFHRNLLAICDTFARHVLRASADDVFIGSPPFAFTFGLGGLLLFPLRIGASAALLENGAPPKLAEGIRTFGATVCFTAPTSYRMLAALPDPGVLRTLRKCVSAGEALPAATRELWRQVTGIELIDGIGSTELLHIFISADEEHARPGCTGQAVPGFQACVLDEEGRPLPPGQPGRLAVKGPTGCLYLDDERQKNYVQDGWNITGDTYLMDEDGYFVYQARSDDMIISSGYNIAAPEVEGALLSHPAVAECAVVGVPDELRGQVVKAYVVLNESYQPGQALTCELQTFVKAVIAPYKYPRRIEYRDALPKTATGKLQRFLLRQEPT